MARENVMDNTSVINSFNNGLKAYRKNDYRKALQHFEDALEGFPQNSRYLSYVGLMMVLSGKDSRIGFDYLQAAIELDPKRSELYLNAFLAYKKIGNLKMAFEFLYEGENIDPKNPAIKKEFELHGRRKEPVFKSLDRDHFLNKFFGKLYSSLGLR